MDELTSRSAIELARLIRDGHASSVEVTTAHLARINALEPRLHAMAAIDRDATLAVAQAADAAMASGETVGPLHGVPFTVKDWIEAAGLPCAAGIEARRNFIPRHDATVVARMRAAGAVLLGKTRPWQDGLDPPVANPQDTAHTPGGSSAGEAALIAAGGSPLGLGSDSGGSLRFPAHCCGIATLKPTAGLVPVTGHFPRVGGMADSRTQIGPMARTIDDLALAFHIVAGPDARDAGVVPMPLGDPAQVEIRGLRVAMFEEVDGVRPDADTTRVLREVASVLEAAGASVEEQKPPRIDETSGITVAHWRRTRSYSWNEWLVDAGSDPANPISADEIEQSIFAWDRLNRALTGFMEKLDLLLTPACPYPAPLAGQEHVRDFAYTLTWSLSGQPCVVLRAGTSGDGLPIGVQIVARMWRDDIALAAASFIERSVGPWPIASVGDA